MVREPFLAAAFTLYLAALRTPRRRWEPTLVIAVLSGVGALGLVVAGPGPPAAPVALPGMTGCVLLGAAWTVGRAVRERRAYAARYAAQVAERAATEERLRIARELHDVVSHTLSMIGVKAAVANHVARQRPQEVRDALRVIEDTSRQALSQMRRMLGVLRAGPDAAGEHPAFPAPDAGGDSTAEALADRQALADPQRLAETLADLVAWAGDAGVEVDLEVTGLDPAPAEVAASAYRIVQEAVTNVVRHAPGARCRVRVSGDATGVRVEVRDGGARAALAPAGYGLLGMRERAVRHGGTFSAGFRSQGGFEVLAWLPYRPPGGSTAGAATEVGA